MVKHSLIFLPLDPCANPGKHIWVNEKAGAQEEDRVPKASPVDAHMIVRTSSPAFTGGETEAQAHTWICYGQAPSRVFLWPAGTLRRVPQMHPHFLRRCTLNSPGSTRPPSGPPGWLHATNATASRACSCPEGQMACLHLHPLHTVQPEEQEGEATDQTEPRSQCLLPLLCIVCWKLDHEVYRNQGL